MFHLDPPDSSSSPLATFGRHKHSLLLGTLVALLLVSPLIEGGGSGSFALSGLFSLVVVVGTLAVSRVQRDLVITLALSAAWLYLTWLHPVWSGGLLDELASVILAACTFYMAGVLLVSVVTAEKVTHDVISGAIAIYLLMGIAWSVIYVLIEGISPGSFGLQQADHGTIWEQLLYFSFTTLTTLGYGDITPLSPIARMWTVFEAISGTFFLAILISRLVSLYKT
ncbi:potassium channel family protein [Pelagibius sp.]|uniref:potassium channel family protein n=1 Tax=Pelagibius sp. TaxID=1931238 RepID=UPI002602EC7B|nr:potassium channel family protein [Pelagibius sp.]